MKGNQFPLTIFWPWAIGHIEISPERKREQWKDSLHFYSLRDGLIQTINCLVFWKGVRWGSWARTQICCACENPMWRLLVNVPPNFSRTLARSWKSYPSLKPFQGRNDLCKGKTCSWSHLSAKVDRMISSICVQIQFINSYAVSVPGQGLCKQCELLESLSFPSFSTCSWVDSTVFCLHIGACVCGGGEGS